MGKKKFLDKKKAATFALLYRVSGHGEELGDERVYTRVDNNLEIQTPDFDDDSRYADADDDSLGGSDEELELRAARSDAAAEQLRRDLLEMGFPDDGYNYMKHMRTMGSSGTTLFVPSTNLDFNPLPVDVKAYDASSVRVLETVSDKDVLIEKNTATMKQIQAPSFKDPEVVAALQDSDLSNDEDDNSDFEDDFILLANKDVEGECSREADDHEKQIIQFGHEKSEAVNLRVDEERALGILEEQFEVLAVKEYEEDAEEDDPEARGQADISQFNSILDEFLAANPILCGRHPAPIAKSVKPPAEVREVVRAESSDEASSATVDEDENEDVEAVWIDDDEDRRETWDCETVVSTMSNLDNHPSRIATPGSSKRVHFASVKAAAGAQTIRLGGKQKLPLDFIKKPTTDQENAPSVVAPKSRTRGESREERKAHKLAVKEERRASRKAKKELKTQFKMVSQRAQIGAAVVVPRSIHLS